MTMSDPMSAMPALKLYLISQSQRNDFETYSCAVVCAQSEDHARNVNPKRRPKILTPRLWKTEFGAEYAEWCSGPEHVAVKYLGEAAPGMEIGVICASFNAG